MLPSRNRVQAKKILSSSQPVVLAAEPVLTKRPDGAAKAGRAPASRLAAATSAVSEARSTPGEGRASGGGTLESAGNAAAGVHPSESGEQYTYVTDESGYTWLYDATSGQYYYYDEQQATYLPYTAAPDSSAGVAGDTAEQVAKDGEEQSSKQHRKSRRVVRMAGGQVWEDATLDDWPTDDYRLFAGDLGPEVTSEMLEQVFGRFRSLQRTHVVREKSSGKSRGYGFLSFGDADDFLAAWKEFNGKYVGNRPIKLRKSTWRDRNVDVRKAKRVDKRAFMEYRQGKR
ncbi:hypothetical protein IWQ57_001917 [Coemansia nantahalensis]|uniref:Uncharacterized protein n=1 Tax=Coemansia nantahalensis TaxID=2789366 RepID=A0ACC1K2N3_9FUNG|nr:hypothetical protein IWQ57_001917 [Coemansia nantahalensis]